MLKRKFSVYENVTDLKLINALSSFSHVLPNYV